MKQITLALLFMLLYGVAKSQNTIGLPQIINYNNNDFHGGPQTWDIAQDINGMMYFANNDGLLTFDGSHWQIYRLPNKTIARSLYIDKTNKIFIGGQDEFGYYIPDKNGNLLYVSLKNLIPEPQKQFADIWDIVPFGESIFFRATDRIFELKNNAIRVFTSKSEWRFMKRAGSKLIAQDKAEGLLEFKNNGWYSFTNKKPFDSFLVTGIIDTGNDHFLVSTLKNGLFTVKDGVSIPKQTEADFDLAKRQTYTLASMNETEFVAGTTSNGCVIMNFEGKIVQKITREDGLQNNNVLCLFLDKNNNLWAGLNNGISFIAYNSAIKYIRPNKTNDLSGYATLLFNKSLYIATSDGTYMAPLSDQNKDLSFSKSNFIQIGNSNGQVWRIDEVNEHLLMGYNDGVYGIKDNEAFPITQGTGGWLFVPTSSIFPSNTIIAGTYLGLNLLGFSQNKFTDLGKIEGITESLRFLAMGNNNDIWASHPYRGVFKIQLLDGQKKCKAELLTAKDGLPSSLGNYVFKIKNRVVFATEKGVFEYDASSKKFIRSAFLTPVFGSMEIRYLNEDADGNIWFCSGKQVGVVNFRKKNIDKPFTITWFPELTGQILTGFENIYPLNKQNIFIGSEKGIIHLNYEKYIGINSKLSVLLSQVKAISRISDTLIFGGHFKTDANSSLLQQNKKRILDLDNSFNSFHFEYSSPAFGLQKNIEYSYQLQGFDDQWSQWSPKTEKDYTNLPAGKYVFNIKARDNLGHESAIVSYGFVVEPAWYYSMWAKMFYILIVIFLLYLFYKFQQRK
ncbi:MAG TPA: triple tyrosine motif-containing protein, partial [Hanamia sp.]|nr:triple tyrosine motif-containing protein [Hanamia sp.]